MSFRWKIFLLCIATYILALGITGVIVTERSYQALLRSEVERSLQEQGGIYSTAILYIMTNQKQDGKINIEDYGQRVVDLFSTRDTNIELFREDATLIASSMGDMWKGYTRKELAQVSQDGKNYIFRRNGPNHYLFISDTITIGSGKMLMSVVKDVTYADKHRNTQYMLFLQIGLVGLIFVAVVTGITSRLVIKPIEKLTDAARSIASGNYGDRVQCTGKDEVGQLAEQFNIMAGEVQKHTDALKEEGERKQLFIDNLTHELRTPLTSIIGFSEYLLKAKDEPGVYEKSLNYINSEGKRMLKLINGLMDMILLRQGSLNQKKEQIRPILIEVADIMARKASAKQIRLSVNEGDAELNVDRDMIKGVIINLVDNALNASEAGAAVSLGIERIPAGASIYVADQGKGISKEDIDRILEPFYRVDKARSRKEGGLGLGLSICSEVVKSHGARLELKSEPGNGTVARIIF